MEELFGKHYSPALLREVPVLTLAHVGDGVYELLARGHVVDGKPELKVAAAHRRTVVLVSAAAQSKAAHALESALEPEEALVFRRGRNVKLHSIPRHASLEEYAYATALEALFGHLYLAGRQDRISQLWQQCLAALEEA